jgi:hypothetical protein
MKPKLLYLTFVVFLTLTMLACGTVTVVTQPTATQQAATQPPATQPPAALSGKLEITSTNAFTEKNSTYHVVGEVKNGTDKTLTDIELTIEIKDASGNSLLKDDSGNVIPSQTLSTLLSTLAPGEASPFAFSYDTTNGTPASFKVSITGQQTGQADRATLNVENAQLYDDKNGTLYLSGELVNTSSKWAYIHSVAGAALDSNSNVLSADWSVDYTTELAPTGDSAGRDRTPFLVYFPTPGSSTVTDWVVYSDADVTDAPTDYSLVLNVTNHYFDQFNSFHIVGTVTNNSTQTIHTLAVAGLYAADKKVLDASYEFIQLNVEPEKSVPFDFSGFSSVNYNPEQAAKLDSYTVQYDPWSTYPPVSSYVTLTTTGDQIQKDGANWTVTGNVTNTSSQALSSETVVVTVLDAKNKVVAMGYTYVSPTGDSITTGEKTNYSVGIYLDPKVDASGYTIVTNVQGDVK